MGSRAPITLLLLKVCTTKGQNPSPWGQLPAGSSALCWPCADISFSHALPICPQWDQANCPCILAASPGHSCPHLTWAALVPCFPVAHSWGLVNWGCFLGSGLPFVAVTRASSVLGVLLDESVHAEVLRPQTRAPGEEGPQKDPGCRVRPQGRGTALSLPSRGSTAGVTSVHLCHEIQSPVSTKRTGLGPGRVSAMFKPQVEVFYLFLDLRNLKIIKLKSSKGWL